jgi:hypothetical protein
LLLIASLISAALLTTNKVDAQILFSENFDTNPDINAGGNWNSNITDGAVPVAGTWDTSGGIASAANVGVVQSNTQYSFDASELSSFGSLYDSVSNTVGGGNVAGSLYARFDVQMVHPNPANLAPNFAGLQLQRGTTTNRANLDDYVNQTSMLLGKNWGHWAYSYVAHGAVAGDFNAPGPPDPAPYRDLDTDWHTIVARIDYNANSADAATVWFDPDFNLTEAQQSADLTTSLLTGAGNFSFDTFLLRAGNTGMTGNFDNVVFGATATNVGFVPEPTAGLLMLSAFACCGIVRVCKYRLGKA